jgi:hypothetical protein
MIDEDTMNFIGLYGNVIVDLHHLIGLPIERKPFSELSKEEFDQLTPIEKSLFSISEHHAKGRRHPRDIELQRMATFVRNLKVIRYYNQKLFRKFKQVVKQSGNNDSFFGVRYEIAIAELLIRNSFQFKKRERPDFQVTHEQNIVFLECGSARLRGGRIDKPDRKILQTINTKCSQPYEGPSTALFVDVTNVFYNTMNTEHQLTSQTLREVATRGVNTTKFGAIVLSFYMFENSSRHYECKFMRVDSSKIDRCLANFLNNWFRPSKEGTFQVTIPSEG